MKQIFIIIAILFSCTNSTRCYSQNKLDLEKNVDAELFIKKKDYIIAERLKEIESVVGKQVTVFVVIGKSNKIKQTYSGIVEMADYPKINDKSKATLITVKVVDDNGQINAYFPLTNDKRYRIYLTEKMK